MANDYYGTLGVSRTASPEEIQKSDNPVVKRFVVGEADERELASLHG